MKREKERLQIEASVNLASVMHTHTHTTWLRRWLREIQHSYAKYSLIVVSGGLLPIYVEVGMLVITLNYRDAGAL